MSWLEPRRTKNPSNKIRRRRRGGGLGRGGGVRAKLWRASAALCGIGRSLVRSSIWLRGSGGRLRGGRREEWIALWRAELAEILCVALAGGRQLRDGLARKARAR